MSLCMRKNTMFEYEELRLTYQSMSKVKFEKKYNKILHYTNTEVLDKILQSATFRATHVLYLNDAEEYYKGKEYLCKELGIKSFPNYESQEFFTISFTEEDDLLSQWITYAKESGVSIELDSDLLRQGEEFENKPYWIFDIESDIKEKDERDKNEDHHLLFDTADVICKVKYLKNDKDNRIIDKKLVEDVKKVRRSDNELSLHGMPLYATYIKNNSFAAEKEIRASFMYHERAVNLPFDHSEAEDYLKIHPKVFFYRTDKGILRPYLNVKICQRNFNDEDIIKPLLPLKSITVGPSGNQQAVFDSVVHRLKYGECKLYNYSDNNNSLQKRKNDFYKEVEKWWPTKIGREKFSDKIFAMIIDYFFEKPIDFSKNQMEKNIVEKIKKDFYFSPKGIIVRKSKIPYIF